MSECKILGRSQIDDRNRITLVKSVFKLLNVNPGEFVVYDQREDGTICIHSYGLRKKSNNKIGGGNGEGSKTD